MPDLDQGNRERGTGACGLPRAGRAILPAGRAPAATTSTALPGCCSPVRARLTRNAVELALAGDPAA